MEYVALSRVTYMENLLIYYQHFSRDEWFNIKLDAEMIAHDIRTDRLILQTDA